MHLKGHSLILHIYTVNTLILKDLGTNKTVETALKHTQKNEARLHQVPLKKRRKESLTNSFGFTVLA